MLYFIILFKKDGLFIKLCKSNLSIINLSNLIQYFSKYQSGENIGKRNVIVFIFESNTFEISYNVHYISNDSRISLLNQTWFKEAYWQKVYHQFRLKFLNMICSAVYYNVVKNIYVFELWHLSISFFLFCNIFIQIPSWQHNVIKIYHI